MARVGERPAVQKALAIEGLVPHGPKGIFYGPEALVAKAAGTREAARA